MVEFGASVNLAHAAWHHDASLLLAIVANCPGQSIRYSPSTDGGKLFPLLRILAHFASSSSRTRSSSCSDRFWSSDV